MAQQQQNITIAAPGFMGVNTQLSPLGLGPEWARLADNCVIDRFGRVGARSGYTVESSSNANLNGGAVTAVHRMWDETAGSYRTFLAGDNKIMLGDAMTDETPVAATVTADDWQMFMFNDDMYCVQDGQDVLMWDSSAGDMIRLTDHASALSVPSGPTCGLGAFGKLWLAKGDMIWWSDTLIGPAFTGGASGSINLQNVWPAGYDNVVALTEHNGFLIIFGERTILVYEGAFSPANMSLSDTIRGIGCAARDSVQSVGTDLLFLDDNGVRSLGRVIQEKSAPIGDISANVHTDVITSLDGNNDYVRAQYSAKNGFYLLSFPTTMEVYCFDLRNGRMEDGSARTTVWTGVPFTSFHDFENELRIGNYDGVCTYGGYVDGVNTYRMRYYSHPQTFGSAATLKFPKQLDYFLIGGTGQEVSLAWGFGYDEGYRYKTFNLGEGDVYEWGVAEYDIGEFVVAADVGTPHVNTTGSGKSVSMGFEATIAGGTVSIQEMNLQTLIGRIV